jgi:hypothetical protein
LTDPGGVFLVSEVQSLWTLVPEETDNGWLTTTRPLTAGAPPKSCSRTGALIVAGIGATLENGTVEFRVSDFHCAIQELEFVQPMILLATAVSERPVYMTTGSRALPHASDLQLRFFAWDVAGNPTRVSFRWQLTAAVVISLA